MKLWKPIVLWLAWVGLAAGMSTYLGGRMKGTDARVFLPGPTTHGHYQIELACNACHTPMMGVKEQACIDCHAEELKAANDSHPKAKFTDPRNADRLKSIAADNCITCHREHSPGRTGAMGVTLPEDYCYHCHQETLQERPSHRDYAFNSCATAGCHNYHDNTALYESFLAKHLNEPAIKDGARRTERNLLAYLVESGTREKAAPLTAKDQNAPAGVVVKAGLLHAWVGTAHARAGVNCGDCHLVSPDAKQPKTWADRPGHAGCASCHQSEVSGFLAGRHGMRLARNLTPMTPGMARLPMKPESAHRELTCASCHGAHEFDSRTAAVESCLSCHNDSHGLAYRGSAHFSLWEAEMAGRGAPGSGVSCATCHLPREIHRVEGINRVVVQHNQNTNLRPNEKMIRGVCMDCHGVEFALDALADAALVRANFTGRPARHVESMDLVARRLVETRKPRTTP